MSDNHSEPNTFSPQISLIQNELLKERLSSQMRTSLTEKLSLLEKYAEESEQGERITANKDDHLLDLSPEVNDPQFQQGIFPGGDHLLWESTFSANNFFQTKYKGNFIQVIAGNNISAQTGKLYLIITSENKIHSQIIDVGLPGTIEDLTIVSFEEHTITLVDQLYQVYGFDYGRILFFSEN